MKGTSFKESFSHMQLQRTICTGFSLCPVILHSSDSNYVIHDPKAACHDFLCTEKTELLFKLRIFAAGENPVIPVSFTSFLTDCSESFMGVHPVL